MPGSLSIGGVSLERSHGELAASAVGLGTALPLGRGHSSHGLLGAPVEKSGLNLTGILVKRL